MTDSSPNLQYLITISPLGMLYGSSGPFLSPDSLVGRSGNRFPPSTATVAGLYGATQWKDENSLNDLYITGPFWAKVDQPEAFYVPTPMNFRVTHQSATDAYAIVERWQWQPEKGWHLSEDLKEKKSIENTWVNIEDWSKLQECSAIAATPIPVISIEKGLSIEKSPIWCYHPHLHPRLEDNERHVVRKIETAEDAEDSDLPAQQGSLFLENGVQVNPEYCLVYLSSRPLSPGWYRFGGEGHMADVQCTEISSDSAIHKLMEQPLGHCFSLLVPAVWGTQRFSYRFPVPSGSSTPASGLHDLPLTIQSEQQTKVQSFWDISAIMTTRPIPFRFRLGGTGKTKRLSRGRYAVPAGTVYQVATELEASWPQWPPDWFPKENYSYQHWGCGFALSLSPTTTN